MPSIRFLPDDVTAAASAGETIFDVARRHDVTVETSCVGRGTCGLCRVKILSGEEALSPFNETEQKHLGNVYFLNKVRLSCQTAIADGDVTVELVRPKTRKNKR